MLADLITWLKQQDQDALIPYGFGKPMSFRGNYSDLAFEPKENVRIYEMLDSANSALGKTFEGYKGGEFSMDGYSRCWIAEYGEGEMSSDLIGPTMLKLWEYCIKKDSN